MLGLQTTLLTALRHSFFSRCLAAKLLKTKRKAAVLSQDSLPPTSLPVCVYLSVARRVFGFRVCVEYIWFVLFHVRLSDPMSRFTYRYMFCVFSPTGRSSLFPIDDNLLDDGHGNQGVPGVLGSPNCYPHQNGERIERFSRKVFVGGLPPDIDEGEGDAASFLGCARFCLCSSSLVFKSPPDEITSSFRRFGHLVVDWPHKAESKSYFPPKGTKKGFILGWTHG